MPVGSARSEAESASKFSSAVADHCSTLHGRGPAAFHGADGRGGIKRPEPTLPLQVQHAVNLIIDQVRRALGEIIIAVWGPMTNMAAALAMAPDIAEFNFWFDPHAAHAVLASNVPMVVLGLAVTNKALIPPERVRRLSKSGRSGDFAARMLTHYAEAGSLHLHDPCVTAYLVNPELFSRHRGVLRSRGPVPAQIWTERRRRIEAGSCRARCKLPGDNRLRLGRAVWTAGSTPRGFELSADR